MIPISDCKFLFLIPRKFPSCLASSQTVQKRFMAYIVDLIHVLEILFALTASVNEKDLTRRAIKRAFTVYHDSQMKITAHDRIRKFDFSKAQIPGRDIILEEIVSLVRNSYTNDEELSQLLARIPPADLASDEDWDDGGKKAR